MATEKSQHDEERIAEEAASWVARLQSSDATADDRRQFERWLQREPAHESAYNELKDLWTDLKDVPIASDRIARAGKKRRSTIANIVAITLIGGLALILYRTGFVDRWRADHYTVVGEVRSITLADGTRVDLNTDTAIAVRFSTTERRIELIRGEAYFDVGRDPRRPFIVEDSKLAARDIGTRYSMRTSSEQSLGDVQVEDGQVEVSAGDRRLLLGPGEAASLTKDGRLSVSSVDVSADTAWRGGKLVFSGRPLREVLATLARYRNGRIVVLDDNAANQTVSGIFDLKDTDQALRSLEESLPVTVTHMTGLMVVVRSR